MTNKGHMTIRKLSAKNKPELIFEVWVSSAQFAPVLHALSFTLGVKSQGRLWREGTKRW